MTEKDREKFMHLVEALASSKGKESSEALFLGFWIGLDDLEIGDVELAVRRAIKELKFFPSPAELRELAGVMSPEARAIKAAEAAFASTRRLGAYASVDFDDPVVNATVRNGWQSWKEFCAIEEGQVKWARKEFERIYASLVRNGVSRESTKHLAGVTEGQNSSRGYDVADPVRVECGLPPHKEPRLRALSGPRIKALDEQAPRGLSPAARAVIKGVLGG